MIGISPLFEKLDEPHLWKLQCPSIKLCRDVMDTLQPGKRGSRERQVMLLRNPKKDHFLIQRFPSFPESLQSVVPIEDVRSLDRPMPDLAEIPELRFARI